MRFVEESQLKKYIKSLKKFTTEYSEANSFFDHIHEIDNVSLQSFSFERDMAFFDELSKVLSYVLAIIAKPHISNKREEVIIRAEQAAQLPSDAFQKVLKDSTLWKEKDISMIPEYVYYYQYTDELNIYENQFIVLLVNLINEDVNKYLDFYISMIPSFDNGQHQVINSEYAEDAISKLEYLRRKIKNIKGTYFYREINRSLNISKSIKPTNILIKDRLYRYCFKFYRQFITYEDPSELQNDIRRYFGVIFLNVLKSRNFTIVDKKNNVITARKMNMTLTDKLFTVTLKYSKQGLSLNICMNTKKSVVATHELIIDEYLDDLNQNKLEINQKALSTCVISLWNLFELKEDSKIILTNNPLKERELVEFYLDNLFNIVTGSVNLYDRYCPVCRSRNIENENHPYRCLDCKSVYLVLTKFKRSSAIWFLKKRRD